MKRFAVLGAGLMGKTAAEDLIIYEKDAEVYLFDYDAEMLEDAKKQINNDRLTVAEMDINNIDEAVAKLKGCDAAVDCLPIYLAVKGMEACCKAGVSVTSLNGEMPEEKWALNDLAKENNVTIIPGIGVSPGTSHVFVGRGVELLDSVNNAMIYVGGIPVNKRPPLNYSTVYSLSSVMYYYLTPAKICNNGKVEVVEALTGLDMQKFDAPFGDLESFYTDGLTSLAITMKDKVKGMLAEKTLRYPGHRDAFNILRASGLVDEKEIDVDGVKVSPQKVLINALEPILKLDEDGDILVLRVIVDGEKDGKPKTITFDVLDYLDKKTGSTAMARTTVFPATSSARMIANGEITEKGVVFPELAFPGDKFDRLASMLKEHEIDLKIIES